ncbi:MAG TPA: VCBS repeat-containing protein, partial [Gemmataceae bacterium]|nr:VCBS repeat-containing protein [Gemmataceae bacterium]
ADDAPGGHIKAFSGADNSLLSSFLSFPGFSGRVNVSAADFNLDRADEIVAGVNSNGHVKVFNPDGTIFTSPTFFGSFLAFQGYAGGISVAAGDVNGDGVPDIIVGAQSGQGHVKAFSGKDGSLLASFLAYEQGFTGGVNVAVGDFNKDGRFEIRTAPGKGRRVEVRAFDVLGVVLDTFQPFGLYDGGANISGERA